MRLDGTAARQRRSAARSARRITPSPRPAATTCGSSPSSWTTTTWAAIPQEMLPLRKALSRVPRHHDGAARPGHGDEPDHAAERARVDARPREARARHQDLRRPQRQLHRPQRARGIAEPDAQRLPRALAGGHHGPAGAGDAPVGPARGPQDAAGRLAGHPAACSTSRSSPTSRRCCARPTAATSSSTRSTRAASARARSCTTRSTGWPAKPAVTPSSTPTTCREGLEKVIRDASHHYLIGYAPTRELNDGKFHQIAVKVKRKGARTVARRGYWAPSAEEMTAVAPPPLEPAVLERPDEPAVAAREPRGARRDRLRARRQRRRAAVGHVAAGAGLQGPARNV